MTFRTRLFSPRLLTPTAWAPCLVWAAFGAHPAWAVEVDRTQPISLTFERRGLIDIAKGRTEVVGNVVMTRGSTLLRAERAGIRETPDGFYQAFASGTSAQQVAVRQGRDAPGAAVEGAADRLHYDTRADTVSLSGNASMRQLHRALVTKEVTGAAVVYDRRADMLSVEGGSNSPNPKGRGRIVLMPPPASEAEGHRDLADATLKLKPALTLGLQR